MKNEIYFIEIINVVIYSPRLFFISNCTALIKYNICSSCKIKIVKRLNNV